MKKGNLKADTYAVNEKVWNFMKRLYGGGPEIPQGGKISSILSDTKDDAKRANSLGRIDSIKNADVLRSPDLMTRSDAPDIMRMSYSSDLMTKSTPILSSRPSGMSNEMFYCYLNATFQCIMGIKPLVEYTISGKYNAAVHKNKIPKFWKAFSEVVQMNSKGTKFTPKQIRRITTGNFDPSQQHDSHEFMRYILSGLQDEINMPRPKKIIEFKDANTAWEHYRKYNSSIIDDLFAGQLISRVTCRSCNNISYSYDPFLDISLPVIPEKTRNLDDCIGAFLKEEDIKDSYACEKCKLKNRCSKKFSIFRFPKILALHLKRFQTFPKKRKISANVDFPLDKLKIKK
jgi:ubiquitin C-terminal hydrolase